MTSGVAVFAAYGLSMGALWAYGCSSSSGNRDAGAQSTGTGTGVSTSTSSSTTSGTGTGTGTGTETTDAAGGADVVEEPSAVTCGCPTSFGPTDTIITNGGIPAGTCPLNFTFDGVQNSWFPYDDGTSDAGFTHASEEPGCAGPQSCAYYAQGSGFTNYGAGVGFTLNANAIFNAGGFAGMDVWLSGTTVGTRGLGFTPQNDTVHVKFVTALPDGGDPREGDDYGAYCPIPADAGSCFTECNMPFAGLTRDGYKGVDAGAPNPATDMFDPQNLAKIQFEFSSYMAPDSSVANPPVSFNVIIADPTFTDAGPPL